MKKITVILLALCLMLSLAACGKEEAPAPTEAPAPVVTETPAAPAAPAPTEAPAPVEEAPAEPSDMEKAESCIGGSVEDLYDLIGEPQSSDYAPSCNGGEGAEDGNLYYDGFIVYTLKEGDNETVVFVE